MSALGLGACGGAGSSSPASTSATVKPAVVTTPTTVPVTAPPPTTAPPPKPVVLLSQQGSGIANLPAFVVASGSKGWVLNWNYSCAAYGSSGNFIVDINTPGNALGTSDAGVNELGNGSSGTENYYDAGTFQLQVNSECSWGVQVVSTQ